MEILIIGHGYSAAALTPMLRAEGWQVIGTTRSRPDRVEKAGAVPLIWPGDDDAFRAALDRADAILVSTPPDENGDPVLTGYAQDLARSADRLRWLGYLSTTGVYGDRNGDWVDEDSALNGTGLRARARIEAEAAWQGLAKQHGLPLHIFRLAGIYGPGRGPFEKIRNGTARRIIKPGQVFSRIHVEDIARALAASIRMPRPGAVYNLCDDEPAPPEDVIAHAARLLGYPLPPEIAFDEAARDMSAMARSFYADSKRVRNDRIKRDLGLQLLYPDYRSGLAAILRAETEPGSQRHGA
ncbi:MAG: SDR family oxidoreductase [Paracoccus sp. (in: a-proteobacteria)]|nr:SDR family oxidoreductase [Paracoccus sp. (in: a-proteobacteria)]